MMMLLMFDFNSYAHDGDAPDMALIEFIGEAVNADNEVIDPIELQAMENMTGKSPHDPQSIIHTPERIPQDHRQHGNE
jgi:hypothetical protein